jgi:hypothetical protein
MSDDVKTLSFTLVSLIGGLCLLVLALAGGVTLERGGVNLEPWARIAAGVLGGGLILAAALLEMRGRWSLSAGEGKPPETSGRPSPSNFFYTLDHAEEGNFPALVRGATRVSVLSRTAVNLFNHYSHTLEELARAGCEIRLLVLDPSSEACAYVYGGSVEFYRHNISVTEAHLNRLRIATGSKLEVRTTKHAPTISIILVEYPDSRQNRVRVQLYFLHSVVGSDRPLFSVAATDKWYQVFSKEFSSLWESATKWQGGEAENLRQTV